MTNAQKREAIRLRLAAWLETADLSTTTVRQAYDTLYPDQVSFEQFEDVWQSLRNPQPEADHHALLESLNPAREEPASEVPPSRA